MPGDVLTEDVQTNPVGPYGESKVKAEEYILRQLVEKPEIYTGRKVIILRPCMIHGPATKEILICFMALLKGVAVASWCI